MVGQQRTTDDITLMSVLTRVARIKLVLVLSVDGNRYRLVREAITWFMNLLFRVLVGATICVAPTVLFIGLWHGLKRMQNGEFVERVADHHGATVEDLLPGTQPYGAPDLDTAERRTSGRSSTGTFHRESWPSDGVTDLEYPDERR